MSAEAVPEFIPVVSRTSSDDFTTPMYMIDHTIARQDGPPLLPDFEEEIDTEVVDAWGVAETWVG